MNDVNSSCRPSASRYAITLVVSLAIYALVLVASLRWLHAGVAEPWKYLVALLPVIPAMGVPYAVVRVLQTMDELELRMQLEALAFAFAAAAIVTFTYGFLQNADLPQVSWVWVWPVMAVCWLVGQLFARRKYR